MFRSFIYLGSTADADSTNYSSTLIHSVSACYKMNGPSLNLTERHRYAIFYVLASFTSRYTYLYTVMLPFSLFFAVSVFSPSPISSS